MGEIVPIHRHPEYMQECCELLNSEWPKNSNIRMDTMRSSRDELPCSFVLIGAADGRPGRTVIGHLQVGLVQEFDDACCMRSVLIRKERRRMGLGKLMMEAAEEHARSLGYATSYLATFDQQEFYRRLGYVECQPVYFLSASRSSRNTQLIRKKLLSANNGPPDAPKEGTLTPGKKAVRKSPSSAPAPPPMPPSTWRHLRYAKQETQTFMKKALL